MLNLAITSFQQSKAKDIYYQAPSETHHRDIPAVLQPACLMSPLCFMAVFCYAAIRICITASTVDFPIQGILSSWGIVTNSSLRIKYLLFPLAEELQFALTRHHQKISDAVIIRSISIKTQWNPFSLTKTRLACSHHTSYYLFLNSLPSSFLCYTLNIPRIPRNLYS